MHKRAEWLKAIALLAAISLFSGCISEKSKETVYTTEIYLNNYIISLNTTIPIETNVSTAEDYVMIFTPMNKNNYRKITFFLYDVGTGNETDSTLERVIQALISECGWRGREWNKTTEELYYPTLLREEINGHQGIIATGKIVKPAGLEVVAAYYPLPGTMMCVHSTFSKNETKSILNTAIVKNKHSI